MPQSLLASKGTMSEFELTVLRRRMVDAALAKARRGELRIAVPVGYVWRHDTGLEMDPDKRVQESIRSVFRLFDRLGSARQVFLQMRKEGLLFPRPAEGKRSNSLNWVAPGYRNIISVLENPFYAGAYAYGKSTNRTQVIEGRLRKTYGHDRPMQQWTVLLKEHHAGYVSWEEYERNQEKLRRNAFSKPSGEAKSGRGGRALLSGLLRCRRCGRMLQVTYGGRGVGTPRYTCKVGHTMHGLAPCINFSAQRPDSAVAQQVLAVVQPLAVEAALMAEQQAQGSEDERRRALELERQQAAYEVHLAERRYQSVDPDNRLVAAELEARWNAALTRLRECEARLTKARTELPQTPNRAELMSLAEDLETAWNAPTTTMCTRQQLVRSLVREVVVDVDDTTREVVLLIHWRGGRHSEVRVRKPQSGEHTRRTSTEADSLIREMATQWNDEHIAATLNRMRLVTGQGLTWTASRVASYRSKANIPAYESAHKDGRCLTLDEAAKKLGVSSYAVRRLIQQKVLPARQVVKDAPWQILAADLESPQVQQALEARRAVRPCRSQRDSRTLVIPGT